MNKPAHPLPAAGPTYEDDLYGWAEAQAALLRSVQPESFDWTNLAEEIEDLGHSQYDALESSLRILILHLMKWDAQPTFRSRSWVLSIREQSRQFQRRLARNPSLKPVRDEIRAEAFRQALVAAQVETGLAADAFATEPPGWNILHNPPMSEADIFDQ